MSGGSLNYLFSKEVGELFEISARENIEEVEQFLLQCGHEDVAKDTRRLLETIKSAENNIGILHENLGDIFMTVEWCLSGDYGKDDLERAVTTYRNQNIADK